MKTRHLFFAALLAGITACGGVQEAETTTVVEEPVVVENTMVRIVNAASDNLTGLTIGEVEVDNRAQGSFTTTRVEMPAGDLPISGTVGVLGVNESATEFAPDTNYTVVLMGDATSANPQESPRAVVFEDDMTPPSAGNCRVRFIHAGTGVGNVSVAVNGSSITNNISYGNASTFNEISGATADLVVSVNGQPLATDSIPFISERLFTVIGTPIEGGMEFIVINEPAP